MFDPEQRTLTRVQLDTSARGGQANQVVPAGIWQSARSLGEYTLVDCSVSPGFSWQGFSWQGFSWQGFELMQSCSEVARTLRDAGGKVA